MRKMKKGVIGNRSWSKIKVGERTTIVAQRNLPDKYWYVYWLSTGVKTLKVFKTRLGAENFMVRYLKTAGY